MLFGRDWSVWIDTIETVPHKNAVIDAGNVGIDLSGLIRLKQFYLYGLLRTTFVSGLICLDWYDWNEAKLPTYWGKYPRRDWSVWIDTIETDFGDCCISSSKKSRDWSVWIDTIETSKLVLFSTTDTQVGIDLSGLIRLKHILWFAAILQVTCRDWSVWIDTIETYVQF